MKLGIYSETDPRLPSTWSGTSANLIKALESVSSPLPCYHAEPDIRRGLVGRLLNKISPASAIFSKIGVRPLIQNLTNYFWQQGCDIVLHIPGDHIPHPTLGSPLRHMVFIDSTFEQFLIPWFEERYKSRPSYLRKALQIEMNRRNQYYGETLAFIEHFFVTSDWVRESLVTSYGISDSKITTCYTGTGNVFDLSLERDFARPKILFVARHNYINKGAGLLIHAFKLIRSKHPNAELILVGPSLEGLGLNAIDDQVTLHSFLDWPDLERMFNSATLFAMPSFYEPYGLVYLEAMKCGTPVVCAATGGMSSIVQQNNSGWVLNDLNAASLASILDEALSDPGACSLRGSNGKSFVQQHCSWDKCAEKIYSVIEVSKTV